MSVMQRNASGVWTDPGTMTGRPMGPIQPVDPAQLQRQAVVDQLGAPGPMAQPAMPGAADPFARGGAVKPLPTGPGAASKIANVGVNTGLSVASKVAGSTAAGAAAGSGINFATGKLADKVRVKEEMPTFGGANSEYLDEFGRRFQGTGGGKKAGFIRGAGYGANPGLVAATGGLSVIGGGLIGMGIAAAKQHAPSAYTDFKVEDAANAIRAIYKKELGRDASDAEVEGNLVGQGWDPKGGDRWVGEKNLNSVMDQIRASPEAQAFKTRGAVMDQLGTAPAVKGPDAAMGVDPATLRNATAPAASGAAPTVDTTVPAGATREGSIGGGEIPGGHGGVTGGPDVLGRGVGIAAEDGAAPAAGAPDSAGWDTDGYAAPATTAQPGRFGMPGFEDDKLADPNNQHPKYVWGRIAAANMQGGKLNVSQAAQQLMAAYPGTTFDGKDKATIPGVGTIDLVRGASAGINAPTWQPVDDGGGSPAQSAADPTQVDAARTTATAGDGGEGDMMAKLRARLQEIMAGSPNREALLAQMGPVA